MSRFGPTFVDEHSVHAPNSFDLVGRARDQDDAVGLKALLSADRRARPSVAAVRRSSCRRKSVAGHPALSKAQSDETALPCEHLDRQLAAVLAGHRPFHALDDRGAQAAVVLELLGAVVHRDAGLLADELVVGALVGILEAAPSADVVDENRAEISGAAPNVVDQPLQRVATVKS